jgi:hypothetical protein
MRRRARRVAALPTTAGAKSATRASRALRQPGRTATRTATALDVVTFGRTRTDESELRQGISRAPTRTTDPRAGVQIRLGAPFL